MSGIFVIITKKTIWLTNGQSHGHSLVTSFPQTLSGHRLLVAETQSLVWLLNSIYPSKKIFSFFIKKKQLNNKFQKCQNKKYQN